MRPLERRHLAAPHAGGLPRRMPGRGPRPPGARRRAAGRAARLARVARRDGYATRDGESAHDRQAIPAGRARCGPVAGGRRGPARRTARRARRRAGRPRHRRLWRGACSQARACRCGRARGARATDSPSRASVVRPRRAGWTSSSGVSSLRAPARVGEGDFVRLAQLYGRHALVMDETGAPIESASCAWHENDLVQEIARRPAGRAWFLVTEETLDLAAGDATVRERIEAAREAGGTVVAPGDLTFSVPRRLRAGRPCHRLGHAHDRRHRRRPGGPSARRRRLADRRPLRGGRRRRWPRDRRLFERSRGRARPRLRRRRVDSRLEKLQLQCGLPRFQPSAARERPLLARRRNEIAHALARSRGADRRVCRRAARRTARDRASPRRDGRESARASPAGG